MDLDPDTSAERSAHKDARPAGRKAARRAEQLRRMRAELPVVFFAGLPGMLGAIPVVGSGRPLSLALLVWLALWAPVAGWLSGSLSVRLVPTGLALCSLWMMLLVAVDVSSPESLPTPLWGSLVFTGLFCGAFGLARASNGPAWAGAGLLLLFGGLLVALPGRAGLGRGPWPAAWTRVLLEISPATLAAESAGVLNWMWHRSVYAPAGSDRIQRAPYVGSLAGPGALLVGCLLAAAGGAIHRRRGR
jgi:hypothetical protein